MNAFWLIVFVLLAGAAALFILPVLRGSQQSPAATRDRLNKALYQDRLLELEEEEAQGVIAERPLLVTELQQNLLQDIPERQAAANPSPIGRWTLLPGVLLLVAVSVGFYLYTGGQKEVRNWQRVMDQLPELRQRVQNEQEQPLTTEEIARLGLGLRTSLQSDGGNISDWMMLGRIGMALNNATTATEAFEQAYLRDPTNPDVRIGYAEVLTRSSDPADNKRAGDILRAMVAEDHTNLRVLSLLAFNAFEQGDYRQAIGAWQVMLKLLPADDQRIEVLKRSIAQAKAQTEQDSVKLLVNVSLSSAAEQRLPQQGTLIISVADGDSSVPVAVKQLPLASFPLTVELDDSSSMMPERQLSSLQQVKVRARISRDGSANAQSDDWFGESALQDFNGNGQIGVQIDRQTP